MKMADVQPDANFFNFLMESAVKRRNYNQAKRIMNKMESMNIAPTEYVSCFFSLCYIYIFH